MPEQYNGYAAFAAGEEALDLKPHAYPARSFGPNDVEIKIICTSICGSDVHTIMGHWGPITYPQVVGHEIIGHVVKIGENVDAKKYAIGTRVGVGAQCGSCHSCKYCDAGKEPLCNGNIFTYNTKLPDGYITQGGYADFYRCDSAFVFPIPEHLDSALAAPLMCAGITVYAPLKRHGAGVGKKVGIIGIGGLGHLALQFAVAMGAEVTAISTSNRKEKEAKELLGAHHFLNSKDQEAMAKAALSFDLVICCAFGNDTNWGQLLSLVEKDGTFVMLALPEKPLTIHAFSLVASQVKMTGSLIGSPEEIEEMLEFASKHDVKPIVEKRPMTDAAAAIKKMHHEGARYRIVLEN
ncbi:chaperonin 10-like protein [Gorgonomyces haynaldii]|nr:chaperonin 10-like protein [Gorgonomyces haynaldii]